MKLLLIVFTRIIKVYPPQWITMFAVINILITEIYRELSVHQSYMDHSGPVTMTTFVG